MERFAPRICVAIAVAWGLACMAAGESSEKYAAKLPDGTTLELVGLRLYGGAVPDDFQGDKWQWWKPDGTLLPQPPDTSTKTTSWYGSYLFALHVSGPPGCTCVAVGPWNKDINPHQAWQKGPAFGAQADLRLFSLRFARGQRIADVRLGVATGDWTRAQEWPFWKDATPDDAIFFSETEVILRCPEQDGGDVVAEVTHGFAEEATRLVIFDSEGAQHTATPWTGGQGAGLVRWVHRFENLSTDNIKRIEFQKRRYDHWIEFRGVALYPGEPTRPQVMVEDVPTGLVGRPLPPFHVLRIDAAVENAKGKRVLLCFWDVGQRPSRNCIQRLAKQQAALASKGVLVIPVHISAPGENPPSAWLEENRIPLLTETLDDGRAKARQIWGARVLPWLVLTDSKHVVTAEGIALDELDQKLE
jgi:hypothetical protein